MERALADAIKNATVAPSDGAGIQLARRYAQLLDGARGSEEEAQVYNDLGPKYLGALTALGLTLAGRGVKTTVGGERGDGTGSAKLDELRARRAARAN